MRHHTNVIKPHTQVVNRLRIVVYTTQQRHVRKQDRHYGAQSFDRCAELFRNLVRMRNVQSDGSQVVATEDIEQIVSDAKRIECQRARMDTDSDLSADVV